MSKKRPLRAGVGTAMDVETGATISLSPQTTAAMHRWLKDAGRLEEATEDDLCCFFCRATPDAGDGATSIVRLASAQADQRTIDVCDVCALGFTMTLMRGFDKRLPYRVLAQLMAMCGGHRLFEPQPSFEEMRPSIVPFTEFVRREAIDNRMRRLGDSDDFEAQLIEAVKRAIESEPSTDD